jgi:predicted membrane protein
MAQTSSHRSLSSLVVGSLLALLGVVLLFDNLGLVDAGSILLYWPVVLIALGVFQIARRTDTGGKTVGMIIGIVGLWILLNNLDIISLSLFALWPLLLIGLGILLLARASRSDLPATTESAEGLNAFALLGGVHQVSSSPDFKGGKLTSILGGCEIDLRQADIKGDAAVIDVFALAGGIEVTVPSRWTIESAVTPILGGVEDKTSRPAEGGKRLVVTGTAILGGVEFKNRE